MARHFLLISFIVLVALQESLQKASGYDHNQQPIPVYRPPAQGFESLREPYVVYYASDHEIDPHHDNTKESPNTSLIPVEKQDAVSDTIVVSGGGGGFGGGGGGGGGGKAAAIAIPIAVGVPLGVLAAVVAIPLAVFGVAVVLAIGFLLTSVIAVGVIGLVAGTGAFLVTSAATIAALLSSGGIGLLSILGIINKRCPYQKLITPCTCTSAVNAVGVNVATINCPSSLSTTAIQAIFNRIPSKYDIDTVNINFQPGFDVNIPENFLGSVAVRNIKLIGSNLGLVPLTIDVLALWASRTKTTTLTIQQFDLGNLNWNFLTNFDALTTISIIDSNNINQPPPGLPRLPNLNQFFVNNVNKFPFPPGRSLIKSARSQPLLLSRGLAHKLALDNSIMPDEDAST